MHFGSFRVNVSKVVESVCSWEKQSGDLNPYEYDSKTARIAFVDFRRYQ